MNKAGRCTVGGFSCCLIWVKRNSTSATTSAKPWDGPNNSQLVDAINDPFRSPADESTRFVAVVGPETCWPGSDPVSIPEISDGNVKHDPAGRVRGSGHRLVRTARLGLWQPSTPGIPAKIPCRCPRCRYFEQLHRWGPRSDGGWSCCATLAWGRWPEINSSTYWNGRTAKRSQNSDEKIRRSQRQRHQLCRVGPDGHHDVLHTVGHVGSWGRR